MKDILLFDLISFRKGILNHAIMILLIGAGVFCGKNFNMSVGEGIFLNGSYTTGFMVAFLSLSIVFIATVIGSRLLFREWDAGIDQIMFSLPLSKKNFVAGRFASFTLLVFACFSLVFLGFVTGQIVRTGSEMRAGFHLFYYLYPLLVFGLINTVIVCSFLFYVAIATKNRMLVVIGGLLIYILYMIGLVYSGSPFMSNSLPQSEWAQKISAISDPFGLSSYFYTSKGFTAAQRNVLLVPLTGFFLLNRILVIGVSMLLVFLGYRSFSFTPPAKDSSRSREKATAANQPVFNRQNDMLALSPVFNFSSGIQSVISYVKIDWLYIFKSVALSAASALLLFYVGMDMYAEIEKGIRLPQKYASSGLMASTINEHFYLLGILLTAYFVNDIFWRSHITGFSPIENATFYSKSKMVAHWLSSNLLILLFTLLLIAEGILFQYIYGYVHLDIKAYLGVLVFNTLPLILFSAFLILINGLLKNKFMALGCTVMVTLLFATPVSAELFSLPLLRFFSGYQGTYSDFNGYGIYLGTFVSRLIFGYGIIGILWMIFILIKRKTRKGPAIAAIFVLSLFSVYGAAAFLKGYRPKNEMQEWKWAATYEKQYRKFQDFSQPTITDVKTSIDLYPSQNVYVIRGSYVLKNLSNQTVDKILINFNKDLEIENGSFHFHNQIVQIDERQTEIDLLRAMKPGEEAALTFKISYHWKVVNGHQSFNSIIRNGSFIRISRYYPSIGYQPGYELENAYQRKEFGLGQPSPIKKLEAPKTNPQDFINLDMIISTEAGQTAIGTGELTQQWKTGNRQYFHYRPQQPVPFRFAVSSANYTVKRSTYDDIRINVYYHPQHFENVQRLIDNAKLALAYCTQNFGTYPFKSITFAEVSSFTRGINATTYPAVIFMAEDISFHANLKADKHQDVINELAGHEVSHVWWGNNQISPDDREGAPMLTETLAMYTEMMICKKIYGEKKMLERLKVQVQIYEASKGFAHNQPLYKVTDENPHIYYARGAIAMVRLSQLLGEQTVNKALRYFLQKYKYPNRPITTDLLNEFYQVSDKKYHHRIEQIFTKMQAIEHVSGL